MSETQKIVIAGKEIAVYPANLGRVKKIIPIIRRLGEISDSQELTEQVLDDMLALLEIILSRNNPEITREFLDENLDLENSREILATAMRAAGFGSRGEASPGEPPGK